jgi:hypothetical protein
MMRLAQAGSRTKRRSGHAQVDLKGRWHYLGSAWRRAVARAGVHNFHFNDIRAKAITDKEEGQGMKQARRMGAHSTEAQTADYVRHRKAQPTGATR